MSLPYMRYYLVIEDLKSCQQRRPTETVFDTLGIETVQLSGGQVKREEVMDKLLGRKNLEEKPIRFVINGSHTCRESLASSIYTFLTSYKPLIQVLKAPDGYTPLYRVTIGIKVEKPGVPEYIEKYALQYAGIHDGSVKILNDKRNVIVEMNSDGYSGPRMSMLLFVINRSEFFTEEMLTDKTLFIKKIMLSPRKMFPNNTDTCTEFVVYQSFVTSGMAPITLNSFAYQDMEGVVNFGKRFAQKNPFIFARFLEDYKIKFSSLKGAFGFSYSIDKRSVDWADIIRIGHKLFPEGLIKTEPIKLKLSNWDYIEPIAAEL